MRWLADGEAVALGVEVGHTLGLAEAIPNRIIDSLTPNLVVSSVAIASPRPSALMKISVAYAKPFSPGLGGGELPMRRVRGPPYHEQDIVLNEFQKAWEVLDVLASDTQRGLHDSPPEAA